MTNYVEDNDSIEGNNSAPGSMLHEWEAANTSASDLAEAIYSRLALVATIESFDDELAPGEVDPATGRYNADNS